jgi:tetratricopeptide (TPR) repeat protein
VVYSEQYTDFLRLNAMLTLSLQSFAVRLPLLALGLSFAVWAGMTGIAGLNNFQANAYLELWNQQLFKNSAYQSTDSDYETALRASQRSIELTPYNADYQTLAANIQMWQLLNNKTLSPAQRDTLKKEILTYYRSALKQRPSWPYTYADFAVVKARFGEIDAEMQQALQTANKLGAREIEILHITLELGLPLWNQLNTETRLTVAGAVERSLTWQLGDRLNKRELVFALSLVGAYERQADICPLLTPESKKISNMCGN